MVNKGRCNKSSQQKEGSGQQKTSFRSKLRRFFRGRSSMVESSNEKNTIMNHNSDAGKGNPDAVKGNSDAVKGKPEAVKGNSDAVKGNSDAGKVGASGSNVTAKTHRSSSNHTLVHDNKSKKREEDGGAATSTTVINDSKKIDKITTQPVSETKTAIPASVIETKPKGGVDGSGVDDEISAPKVRSKGGKRPSLNMVTREKLITPESDQSYNKIPILEQVKLPRGGISMDTKAVGRVQFGIPPETIKDSMRLGLQVPVIYIVPVERFCREMGTALGVNLAEFEFPAYFNFFVQRRRCTLIVDSEEAESNIRRVFSETLLGPIQFRRAEDPISHEEEDFAPGFPRAAMPNFERELRHFRIMPNGEELVLETLLNFTHFESKDLVKSPDLGVPPPLEHDDMNGKEQFPTVVETENLRDSINASDAAVALIKEAEEETVPENWPIAEAYSNGDVATIYPPDSTEEEIASGKLKRVEVFKMPGGTEYILHDIDEHNHIIGRARFSGHVQVSESMSVAGFTFMDAITEKDESESESESDEASALRRSSLASESNLSRSVLPPTFHPPSFGVTVLGNSHGFDKSGSVSGYVLWVNGRGIMIDPPPYSSATLEKEGIRPRTIVGIILTHCHADHDAGAFQKVLTGSPVVVITTPTIYKSFIRKYAALSALSPALLRHSHRHKPAIIGTPLRFQGATFHFTYTLHTIPCVGFRVDWRGRSMVFTGDHFNNPEAIEKLQEKGVLSRARADDLNNLPMQDTDLLLHEAGAPPIHTPLSVLMKLPMHVKKHLYVVHTSALPEDCELKVAPTGTAGTIRLDQIRLPSESSDLAQEPIVYASFANIHDYDNASYANIREEESLLQPLQINRLDSSSTRSPPLVSLRPTSSTDAWFILNLLSAVPFLSSLSYVSTMEVLETARVDTFCINDIVVPSSRRCDVLCVVWEGTCMERELITKAPPKTDKKEPNKRDRDRCRSERNRRVSTFCISQGSHQPITDQEVKNRKRAVAVWHAGDWTGPRSMQPEKKLSGDSSSSKTHDIVAMSSQGVKVITIEFSNLHSILKSGSELYRKYLARKARRAQKNAQAKFAKHNISSSTQTVFDKALENLNIIELLDANSTFRRLTAVQKRHLESLAEGPIHYNAGQRLWRMGAAVDKAFIIVAGTATFLAKRRNAGSVWFKLKEPPKSSRSHSSMVAARLVQEEEERQVTDESLHQSISTQMAADADKVLTEISRADSDSSLSSGEHDTYSANSSRSVETDTFGSVNDTEVNSLVKGFKERADGIKGQQTSRRDSFESNDSTPTNSSSHECGEKRQEDFDPNTNKILGRLFSHRAYTSGLLFSRGHFLGDVSKMVAGLLSSGVEEGDNDQSSDEGSQCDGENCEKDHIHHNNDKDEPNVVHTSTLVAGREGCVVLVFPKASLTPFLDEYPGLLLSLLGTQVIV